MLISQNTYNTCSFSHDSLTLFLVSIPNDICGKFLIRSRGKTLIRPRRRPAISLTHRNKAVKADDWQGKESKGDIENRRGLEFVSSM
jgi:hypothetical protein